MKYLAILLVFVLVSCEKNDLVPKGPNINDPRLIDPFMGGFSGDISCNESGCKILNDFSFKAIPSAGSIRVSFGQSSILDANVKVCLPDALDFYISESRENFEKIVRVDPYDETYTIDNLENGKEYFIKMVNLHCELDSIESPIRSVIAADIDVPSFIASPLPASQSNFEDFRLASDGDQFAFRDYSNDWALSSFSDPSIRPLARDAFYAEWNPNNDQEISFVTQQLVDVYKSVQGWRTKSLITTDITTFSDNELHVVEDPEAYWIHEYHYSLDGTSIYFMSNKDNGGVTVTEKQVYDNIWKLDLATQEIVAISDLLPVDYDIFDFVEDPLRHGNFYFTGGAYNDSATLPNIKQGLDVHYYDAATEMITPILTSEASETNISIDPTGKELVLTSNRSGSKELWTYELSTQNMRQITDQSLYKPSYRWQHINWISDNEFMVYVEHEGVNKFAVFQF